MAPAVEAAVVDRAGERRRDPRRSAHPVQRRQLRDRLPGVAADVGLRPRVLRRDRADLHEAHRGRPRRCRERSCASPRRRSPSPTTRASRPTPPPSAAASHPKRSDFHKQNRADLHDFAPQNRRVTVGDHREPRLATVDDAAEVGRLLHDFNAEFDTPSPGADVLAGRLRVLLEGPETFAILAGDPAVAVALVTLRPNVWYAGRVALLDELYVVPHLRGRGIGSSVIEMLLTEAVATRRRTDRDQRRRGRRRRPALLRAPRLLGDGAGDRRAGVLLRPRAHRPTVPDPASRFSGAKSCRSARFCLWKSSSSGGVRWRWRRGRRRRWGGRARP